MSISYGQDSQSPMIAPSEVQTRTGPIRGGLEYQDSYAILKFVEWLEHPQRYEWMQMEFTEAGFLDDLVTASPEHGCEICQIKYSVHPEAPTSDWTWKTLLTKPGKTKQTLFEKWARSWLEFANSGQCSGKTTGYLITNKAAHGSFLEHLKAKGHSRGLFVDLKKMKHKAPSRYRDALRQIGSERQLERFAANFSFIFDELELDVLKESARERLKTLGVEEHGWNSLQNEVRLWARKRDFPRPGGKILLDDIKKAMGWHHPRPLLQSFPVPGDFVLFNKNVHAGLLRDLASPNGGVKVLEGTPGTGKSTYLSFLFRTLTKRGVPCLRHHYFIQIGSPDFDSVRRLTPESARESLIHDLLAQFPNGLGSLSTRNPNPRDLQQFVQAAAEHCYKSGQALVIIVDGLDHVVRERDAKELKDLLSDLLPVTRGLWLVLGSRPLADGVLPTEIYERAPQEQLIRLSGWDRFGSKRFLWHHRKELKIGEHLDFFGRIAQSFHHKSKGHPLYSRKLLQELQKIASLALVSEWDVERLTTFPDDLERVYASLWRGASAAAQQVAVLLAVATMPLKVQHFLECLGGDAAANTTVQDGIRDLSPFVEEQLQGLVFFHSSFKEFVIRGDQFKNLSSVVLGQLKNWLLSRAPENIRWTHLNRIEFRLGNSGPLLSTTNRDWIVQAICDARPPEHIVEQVSLATHAAMQADMYPLGHRIGIQGLYLKEAIRQDEWSGLWFRAWMNNPNRKSSQLHKFRLEALSSPILVQLAEMASRSGESVLLALCGDVLADRLADHTPGRREFGADEWGVHARAVLVVATLKRIPVNIIIRWIKYVRSYRRSKEISNAFGFALIRTRQITHLREVIKSRRLPVEEKLAAIEGASKAAIATGRKGLHKDLNRKGRPMGPWTRLYAVLSGADTGNLSNCLPPKAAVADPEREYLTVEQELSLNDLFMRIYLGALTLGILDKENRVERWIQSLDRWNWATTAARLLVNIGLAQGLSIRAAKGPSFDDALHQARRFPVPEWPERRAIWGAWRVLRSTFSELLTVTGHLQKWQNIEADISISQLSELRASSFLGRDSLLELLATNEAFSVRTPTIELYLQQEKSFQSANITSFPERTKFYTHCADLAARYGLSAESAEFVKIAASNSVAYGYHKDMYLYEVLEGIEACFHDGSTKCLDWLKRIAPLVEFIGDFTDGDETRHFPLNLASTLSLVSQNSLFDYYVGVVKKENLFLAEDVFPELIETLDFSDPIARSVAMTIVDSDSFSRVRTAAQKGNRQAQTLVDDMTAYFKADEPNPSDRPPNNSGQVVTDLRTEKSTEELQNIKPENVKEFLKNIEDRQQRLRKQGEWVGLWLSEPNISKEVYLIALEWLESNGSRYLEANIFDRLVTYALEFEGLSKAFRFLCDAHRASYGWTWYSHRLEDIQARWERLQNEFPDKWRDFIRYTCSIGRSGDPAEHMSFLPLPRGAEFLVQMRALGEAEDLTNAGVETVLTLVADLKLPSPYWLVRNRASDLIDVLFARLESPSGIIRERAATGISNLLGHPDHSNIVLGRLIEWIAAAKLESLVVVGLLPIAKAARMFRNKLQIDVTNLRSAIPRPSVVSDLLLSEIEGALGVRKRV